MTTWGVSYVVVSALALITALSHAAQAVLIRADATPRAVAAASTGFFLYAGGVAVTRGTPSSDAPLMGLLGLGAGLVLLFAFVPVVGWTLLELPFTRTRALVTGGAVAVAVARAIDVLVHQSSAPAVTWFAVPVGLTAVVISGLWTLDSLRGVRKGTPYARAMMGFGVFATAATAQGLFSATSLTAAPDLFVFAGLPFIAFVTTLTVLRYAHALTTADARALEGDLSRYQVLERLGSGGMGDVFLARRRGPGGFLRDVVLKTLKGASGDREAHARFLAEARVAAQLRHPNIVDVYDLGEHAGGFFIVMEHIQGPTLSDVIEQSVKRRRPIPPPMVAEIGIQLRRALGFAHASGVIHRDLKPQNVMLTFAGVAKLIDFGIARQQLERASPHPLPGTAASSAPQTGVAGTQGFIAPDSLQGEPATAAADLFSLGVLLYLLLAAQYPFRSDDAVEFIAQVRERRARRVAEIRPDCPNALAQAVEQCLAFEAKARPSSAAAVEAHLELAVQGARVDLAAFVAELFSDGVPREDSASAPTTPAAHSLPMRND